MTPVLLGLRRRSLLWTEAIRNRTGRPLALSRAWVRLLATIAGAALLGVAAVAVRATLTTVEVFAVSVQVLTLVCLFRMTPRRLAVCSFFAALWIPYFTLRLLAITSNRTSPYYFTAVRQSSDGRVAWFWVITTAALVAFAAAAAITYHRRGWAPTVNEQSVGYGGFLSVAVIGLIAGLMVDVLHVRSGLLVSVSALILFGIAGGAYTELARRRARSKNQDAFGRGTISWSFVLLLVAVAVGYKSGTKENVMLPVAAWAIGRFAAGQRVTFRWLFLGALTFLLVFATIQGARDFQRSGHPNSNPIAAAAHGLTRVDLAHGVPARRTGLSMVTNATTGFLFRLKALDYFVSIADKVPKDVPFQRGATLWQPAASVIPGHNALFSLNPDLSTLSLGRYVTVTFISAGSQDPSSQSMTFLGEFYLNFGAIGILSGMAVLGILLGFFDRVIRVQGSVSAGLFSMCGLPLLAMDRNVDYVILTSFLGFAATGLLLLVFFRERLIHFSRRKTGLTVQSKGPEVRLREYGSEPSGVRGLSIRRSAPRD